MKAFEDLAMRRFEDEMVEHAREFSPQLCRVLSEAQLRVALKAATWREHVLTGMPARLEL